jgi:hypothetical protein
MRRTQAGTQVDAACHAILIEHHLGVAQRSRRGGELGDRHQFDGGTVELDGLGEYRQYHAATAADRASQQRVAFRIEEGRLRQQDIERDALRAGQPKSVDQLRMRAA